MSRKQYLSKAIICGLLTASVLYGASTPTYAESIYLGYGQTDTRENGIYSSPDPSSTSSVRVVGDGTKLTLINPTIENGEVGPDEGATLIINGGTVNSNNFNTEGGTIEATDVTVNGPIHAGYVDKAEYEDEGSRNSTFTLTNSSINGDSIMSGVGGTINLNGTDSTTYKVDSFIGSLAEDTKGTNAGVINLNGGVLVADNLRTLLDGSLLTQSNTGLSGSDLSELKSRIAKGKIILKDNGVIQTKTGQIFANGIDTTSEETAKNSKDSGKVTNDYINYDSGTIRFTDQWYTQEYLDSAVSNMREKGNTTLAFSGTLSGVESIDVGTAVENFNNKKYLQTPVATEKDINKLLVNGNAIVQDGTQESDSFFASKLMVPNNLNEITISNDKTLALGGTTNGELVTGNADSLNINVDNGTLQLGTTELSNATTQNTLTATVNVSNSGNLDAKGGQQTVSGDVNLTNSSQVTISNAQLHLKGTLTSDDTNTKIYVGNNDSAGTFIAEKATLGANTVVYLDPIWQNGDKISDGSAAALVLPDNKISSKFIIGENSTLSLGTTDTNKAEEIFEKSGFDWGDGDSDVLSAVYLAENQDISGGGVLIADRTATETAADTEVSGTVKLAKNSLLMVDGTKATGENYAISGATSVDIAANDADKQNGAKLYIDNVDKGTYNIIDAGSNTIGTTWSDDNISSNIALLKLTSDNTTDPTKITVNAQYQNVADVYDDDVVIGNLVDKTLQNDEITVGNSAYDFFRNASNNNVNTTKAAQVDAFNSVANLGELGAANHAAYSVSNIMTDSITDHLSLASHPENNNDIWAKYIHNKEDIDNVKLGGTTADYDASFNGIVVGGDFYNEGKATLGAAFAYADGDITGHTLSSRTKNDADFYGLSLYGRINNGDSAVLGDISYLHGSNDITQYNSNTKITASPDTDAFSIGIRAEKAFAAGKNGKIVPYAGVRYLHLGTSNYTNSLGMNYDVDDQNLLLLPIGIKYSQEIKNNDWTIRPTAEVGYVWTTGDRETNQTVNLNNGFDNFGFEITDSGSFIGKLGIQAENDNVAYSLGYEYQNGDTVSSDRWMANVTFKF